MLGAQIVHLSIAEATASSCSHTTHVGPRGSGELEVDGHCLRESGGLPGEARGQQESPLHGRGRPTGMHLLAHPAVEPSGTAPGPFSNPVILEPPLRLLFCHS